MTSIFPRLKAMGTADVLEGGTPNVGVYRAENRVRSRRFADLTGQCAARRKQYPVIDVDRDSEIKGVAVERWGLEGKCRGVIP
ncbi:2og-fe oxygenase [Moniliophthora roreri]|nr:2og-fe oxygenase [Moniliophthora roreri]